MKFRISLLFLTFALATSSSLMAHTGACSNSTIRGTYAFTIHGQVFLPDGSALLIDGLAKTTTVATGRPYYGRLAAGVPEKAQVSVEKADDLQREIRIENSLTDEDGHKVGLKEGAEVEVTVEADKEATTSKEDSEE